MEKGKFILGHLIYGEAEKVCKEAQDILIDANRNKGSGEPLFPSLTNDDKEYFYISPLSPFYATDSAAVRLLALATSYVACSEDKIFQGNEKIFRLDGLATRTVRGNRSYEVSITCLWPESWGALILEKSAVMSDVFFERSGRYADHVLLASGWTLPIDYSTFYEKYHKNRPDFRDAPPVYGMLSDILLFKEYDGSYEAVSMQSEH